MGLGFKSYTGLYIDKGFISLASFRIMGRTPKLVKSITKKGEFDNSNLAQSIKALFKESKISFANVSVCINLPQILIKEIEVDLSKDDWAVSNIPYELENHIPYPVAQAVYAYFIQPLENSDKKKVLIAVLDKEKFDNIFDVLNQANISLVSINIFPAVLANYYSFFSNDFKLNCVLFLVLDNTGNISINIIDKGILRFNKVTQLAFPSALPTENYVDSNWTKIYEEVETAITYFQTIQKGSRPLKICFYSMDVILDEVTRFLSGKFDMKIINLKHLIEKKYIVSLGLILPKENTTTILNLLSNKESKSDVLIEKEWMPYVKGFILFIVIIFMFYSQAVFLKIYSSLIKKKIVKQKQEIVLINECRKDVEQYEKEIESYNNVFSKNINSLDILNELWTFIPYDTYLKTITINKSGLIELKGFSENIESIIIELKKSVFLKNIILKKSLEIKDNLEAENKEFKIVCYFSKNYGDNIIENR